MLSHPDLNRLKVFYYVFTKQSVAKAAEELNITQSAVSQQLKKLETELETLLFTRLHKRLIPTSDAQRLLSILKPFFHELELGLRTIAQSKEIPSGELRVGSPHGFGKAYLPKNFAAFRRIYPKVSFKLWLGDANRIFSMLDKGQLDIAIIDEYLVQRMPLDNLKQYRFEKVIDEELILAGSKEYCEERLCGDYSLENLVRQDFISCHLDALAVTNWFSYHFGKAVSKLNVVLETDSFQTVMEGIESHLGLSITASHLVRGQLKEGRIISIPAPKKSTINRISLVQFKTKVPSLTEQIFLTHFKQEIQQIWY
ncbi:LysR family transcriptional regulator [Desulfovibrio sp. JC010]|uniref:LysR family transcriptional regulator n=1 Tax=Desulfovibrio sp. JC010 TaxID=2593641 RepID=UPI0013D7470A|nr:LysR family transcriptional regulator [Desulfovibrio sp. JC010]NDV27346.1 LysR family transcriptional regulator [Desulfovibrio sp. JC010]